MEDLERLVGSAARAREFIERSRDAGGLWSDFLTLAGESTNWVSGYVGYALAEGKSTSIELLRGTGAKILEAQGRDGGWGYGPGVPSDADSTSWCLLFLSALGLRGQESLERASAFLLSHQSPVDGGFRTYADPRQVGRYMMLENSVSFDGWSSSQTEVTGVAVQALLGTESKGIERALEFIRNSQRPDGYWEPYWWSTRLYSTFHCMSALDRGGREGDRARLAIAQEWVARAQLRDGGWGDAPDGASSPFSTALGVRALTLGSNGKYLPQARVGADWLVASQLPSGSWSSNPILRIPHPAVMEPWNQRQWKPDGRAIGALVRDQRGLYTAATALGAFGGLLSGSPRGGAT